MNIAQAMSISEQDLMAQILQSFYIVDYGYINKVNPDGTVNITHAAKSVLMDGRELPETTTDNVEVLTLSGAGFSLKLDYKAKDRVLILGLKDYVPKAGDVEAAKVPEAFLHYSRSTIKVVPLCIFNGKAKVRVAVENGKMTIDTEDRLELNGNSKQFVTWAELNGELQKFIAVLNGHVHSGGNAGNPTGAPMTPMTLDISGAKTETVVTGG